MLLEVGPGKPVSPSRRRDVVVHLREVFGVSERRACRVTGQQRTTRRHARRVLAPEEAWRARLRAHCSNLATVWVPARLGAAAPRGMAGPSQVGTMAVARGRAARSVKRRRLGAGTVPAQRLSSVHPNHVWTLDFIFVATAVDSSRWQPTSSGATAANRTARVPWHPCRRRQSAPESEARSASPAVRREPWTRRRLVPGRRQ
jgi:hypothetical protein